MEKLIFATNNQHKVEEIRLVLGDRFEIVTLKDAGIDIEIAEPHFTLEENAREKSVTIYNLTAKNCFSEDTGLEVTVLNGEPGVKSARYAGENASFSDNVEKLLENMQLATNREARFRTVISLILDEQEFQFEGICNGKIIQEKRGKEGFGYDPVFIPDGSEMTFAEMGKIAKNEFSHRKKAMDKLISFLEGTDDK